LKDKHAKGYYTECTIKKSLSISGWTCNFTPQSENGKSFCKVFLFKEEDDIMELEERGEEKID